MLVGVFMTLYAKPMVLLTLPHVLHTFSGPTLRSNANPNQQVLLPNEPSLLSLAPQRHAFTNLCTNSMSKESGPGGTLLFGPAAPKIRACHCHVANDLH